MAKPMTSRERLLAAISHREPDTVPIDLGGTRDSSIVVEAYEKLAGHFGVSEPAELCDRMMRVVKVDERVLRALRVDTRAVFPGGPLSSPLAADLGPDAYRDIWGVTRTRPPGSYYYDQKEFPLSGAITENDIRAYRWPDPTDPGYTRGLWERIAWIRKETDCAAVLTLPAPFVHFTQYLRGFHDWFTDFYLKPALMEQLFDTVLDINMEIARRQLLEAGPDVDVVICADDLGIQDRLQMRRETYLKYIKPRHAKFLRQVHDLAPQAKLLFHSCGSLSAILDDLIEIGVDVLNPVQITAGGMDPETLAKRCKGRLAFWGGMESQNTLPFGTVEDVKRLVERLVETLGEGGGFVLSSCHNIQPDVPLANILAMFEHARAYVPSWARG